MRVAPEGTPFVTAAWTVVALCFWAAMRWGGWAAYVPLGLATLVGIWLLVFFRDPRRDGPRGERLVIAPADGRVVDVTELEEPTWLDTRALRISIFMNVFDVHVNRYPVSGPVEHYHYHPGTFLHAATEKASLDNEQASLGLRGPRGPVLVRQIAGFVARRIVTDARPGARAEQGARLGMIRFGSRVDVFLPTDQRAAARVGVGDRVRAGITILAEYP
jgi:phosphatidylserine decarboxylase